MGYRRPCRGNLRAQEDVAPSSQQPVPSCSPVDGRWAGSGTDDGKQSSGLQGSVVKRNGLPSQEIEQVDGSQDLETAPLLVAGNAETGQPPSAAVNASRASSVAERVALMQEQVRDTPSFQTSTLPSTLEHVNSPQPSTIEKAAVTGFESPSLTVNSELAAASPVESTATLNQSGQSWAQPLAPEPQSPVLAQAPSPKTAADDPPATDAAHARMDALKLLGRIFLLSGKSATSTATAANNSYVFVISSVIPGEIQCLHAVTYISTYIRMGRLVANPELALNLHGGSQDSGYLCWKSSG